MIGAPVWCYLLFFNVELIFPEMMKRCGTLHEELVHFWLAIYIQIMTVRYTWSTLLVSVTFSNHHQLWNMGIKIMILTSTVAMLMFQPSFGAVTCECDVSLCTNIAMKSNPIAVSQNINIYWCILFPTLRQWVSNLQKRNIQFVRRNRILQILGVIGGNGSPVPLHAEPVLASEWDSVHPVLILWCLHICVRPAPHISNLRVNWINAVSILQFLNTVEESCVKYITVRPIFWPNLTHGLSFLWTPVPSMSYMQRNI